MLYLAEVQKKQQFIGGFKAELKLLACQRNDQSWSAISGEELIVAPPEEINNLNHAQVVLVEMGGNKQVQRILPDAARTLVTKLENYARQLEKSKKQEEEIEQWKQSLTYQSQELNRREMELEARLEQLQQVEEDFERLEQQRQEIEAEREKAEKLIAEQERARQELEGAWEHLRGEQRRLEEGKAEVLGAAVLDDQQAQKIQDLLSRLSGAIAPTELVREQVNQTVAVINTAQANFQEHSSQLEAQKNTAQKLASQIENQSQDLQSRQREWQSTQVSLEQIKTELKVQQRIVELKQETLNILNLQFRNKEELYDRIYSLAAGSSNVNPLQKVDLQALENMPLGELQEIVQNLQQELEKVLIFVNSQEEELNEKRQAIEELEVKIQTASEYDRISLEAELAEEEDAYQFLNEPLEGQRRSVREREEILQLHKRILNRRQGIVDHDSSSEQCIDLSPVLHQLEAEKQQQQEEIHKLENEIQQMRSSIKQTQEMMNAQTNEQENKQKELQNIEQKLQELKEGLAEVNGKVNVYQETVLPVQETFDSLQEEVKAIASSLSQFEATGNEQQLTLLEMREIVNNLIAKPQLALS